MLSSLREPTARELLTIDLAHLPGNGRPTTEDIIHRHAEFLHVKDSI